jgi:hypothetical protein
VVLWWDFALIFGIAVLLLCCIFWVDCHSSYIVLDVFLLRFVDLSWHKACFCCIRGSENDW